jgi:predicted ester cyclase
VNRALVQQFDEQLLGQGLLDVADEILTADFVFYGPPTGIHGPEGFKSFVIMLRTAFADLQFERKELIVDGAKAGRHAIMAGTHVGEMRGVPGSGARVAFPRIDTFIFEGDKIKEVRAFLDHQEMSRTLESARAEQGRQSHRGKFS